MTFKHSSLVLSAVLLISGCATVGGLFEKRAQNKVYIGTRIHFDLECMYGSCLDFPLSLAADTALLPITIPWSVYNLSHHEDDPTLWRHPERAPNNSPSP